LYVLRINHESGLTICGLVWNPKGNKEIAYTDNQVMVRDDLANLGSCVLKEIHGWVLIDALD